MGLLLTDLDTPDAVRVTPENVPLGRGRNPRRRRGTPTIMDWGPIEHPVRCSGCDHARYSQRASLLDVYPTLVKLVRINQPGDQLEGTSLVLQLKNPQAAKEPVVCTHQLSSHAIISSRRGYIRYVNGDEELYDLAADPAEWNSVADQEKFAAVKTELRTSLPTVNFETNSGPSRRKAPLNCKPAKGRELASNEPDVFAERCCNLKRDPQGGHVVQNELER